jgi:hypothetical protein
VSFARKVERARRRRERKMEAIGGFRVKCKEHGKKPWLGDLVCSKCNAIHLIDDETKAHPTIEESGCCPCGAMMFPVRDENDQVLEDVPFYGRFVCRDCARAEYEKQQAAEKLS